MTSSSSSSRRRFCLSRSVRHGYYLRIVGHRSEYRSTYEAAFMQAARYYEYHETHGSIYAPRLRLRVARYAKSSANSSKRGERLKYLRQVSHTGCLAQNAHSHPEPISLDKYISRETRCATKRRESEVVRSSVMPQGCFNETSCNHAHPIVRAVERCSDDVTGLR